MGKKLPHKYINNILTFAVRNPDYEFNLWVDRYSNFEVSQALLDSGEIPIKLRELSDEVSRLPRNLQRFFERERNGVFANYAAASDIIRIQILLDEGGIYFDTDVYMQESDPIRLNSEKDAADQEILEREKASIAQANELKFFDQVCNESNKLKYTKIYPKLGIAVYGLPQFDPANVQAIKTSRKMRQAVRDLRAPVSRLGNIYAPFGYLYNVTYRNELWHNNNMIGAVQNSFFLKKIQERMSERYQILENTEKFAFAKTAKHGVVAYSDVLWRKKRYNPKGKSRFELTLSTTGPDLIRDSAYYAYQYLASLSDDALDSLVSEFPNLVRKGPNSSDLITIGKHKFLPLNDLYWFAFRINLPSVKDICDNTWTQNRINLKQLRPAEWH